MASATARYCSGETGPWRETTGVTFDQLEGVVVDTHVKRVAGRLGLTAHVDPEKVELDLMDVLPREEWHRFAWRLILHGRNRCLAQRPDCAGCELAKYCPSAFAFKR